VTHGEVVLRLHGAHLSTVHAVVLARDGQTAYSCSNDGKIVRWQLVTGDAQTHWQASVSNPRCLQLSNHHRLLVAGSRIEIWDVSRKRVTKRFTGHASAVKHAFFINNYTYSVTSAEHDRTANIWDCREDTANVGSAKGKCL
jgi:U3 small nucleolar RNA-associated protein 5